LTNKYLQYLLLALYPFYPLWVWLFNTLTHKSLSNYINMLWLPLVIFLLLNKNNRFPKYLVFLILFTLYHLFEIYYFDLLQSDLNWFTYISLDTNVYACCVLFVIENTKLNNLFYEKMNKNVLLIILISVLVSVVQISDPFFFFNMEMDKQMEYVGEGRIFSIYSWIDLNTLGITFPILISIMLSTIDTKKAAFYFVVLSGIVVAFLSRARYVMISTIIAFSQLLLISTISIKKKVYFVVILFFSLIILVKAAEISGFSIQQIIEDRILEKNKDVEMSSALARVTSYYVFLIKFPEHPWFGVGPKTRDDVIELLNGEAPLIHVGYLSYLYFYGIVGSLLLFLALFFLMQKAWIIGRRFGFWGSFYGLIGFCMANTTFVYFNFSEIGIVMAVIYLKYFQDVDESDVSEPEDQESSLVLA
jgi:hypothetical protein